ncbi:MAG TPA: hypothetical protein VKP11_06245, partial [Frankiaceae bacterium]|nr:hypothetical protein [Frankiaceae bacterium]
MTMPLPSTALLGVLLLLAAAAFAAPTRRSPATRTCGRTAPPGPGRGRAGPGGRRGRPARRCR